MEILRKFSGATEAQVWNEITADMQLQGEILEYAAEIEQQGRTIFFKVDIDLGGGFESGYETTNFLAPLAGNPALRFNIHPQDWVNEIGKFLGMEDVELGFPRLDQGYIIKTNQPETLKKLFANEDIRATLRKYDNCDLRIITHTEDNVETATLSIMFETGIIDPAALREIYRLMYTLAEQIENPNVSGQMPG